MNNIRRCKYFLMNDEIGSEPLWETAREGWFMGLYQSGDNPIAIVESYTGQLHETFPTHIKFERTDLDVLLDRILDEAERTCAKSKWPELEKFIKDMFTKYAFIR